MDKLSRLLGTKKFLYWSIFIVTVFIFVGFFWLIYHKDQPKIIPPETRGEIREGIKEEVVKPVQSVWPKGGQVLADAAFGGPTGTLITSSGGSTFDISNWKTYQDEDLGIEFKYPENWILKDNTTAMRLEGSLNKGTRSYLILDPIFSSKEEARFSLEVRNSFGIENDIENVFSDTTINEKKEIKLMNATKAYLLTGTAYKFATTEAISDFKALVAEVDGDVFIFQYVKKVNEEDISNYQDMITSTIKF